MNYLYCDPRGPHYVVAASRSAAVMHFNEDEREWTDAELEETAEEYAHRVPDDDLVELTDNTTYGLTEALVAPAMDQWERIHPLDEKMPAEVPRWWVSFGGEATHWAAVLRPGRVVRSDT